MKNRHLWGESFIRVFLNKVRYLFGMRYYVSSKKYKKAIAEYYCYEREESGYRIIQEILDIVVTKQRNRDTIVLIFTPRPGILIGKAGQEIDSLKKHLIQEFPKESIRISLEEKQIWYKNLVFFY